MSGFKLIAIRPLVSCDRQFLKNLTAGNIYSFYNDYHFFDKEGLEIEGLNIVKNVEEKQINNDVEFIEYHRSIPENFFSLNSNLDNFVNVNISAIVGKNGSGKSTIVELFSLFIFCLSNKIDLINIESFKNNHALNNEQIKRLEKDLKRFYKFHCEIFYSINNKVYSIVKNDGIFRNKHFELFDEGPKKIFKLNIRKTFQISTTIDDNEKIEFLRNSFFYSILANYSLYGQNTDESGIWLKSIFHKNDGYQTPIVLNPMRTDGNIDVNRLNYLSKSRLLNNLFRKLEDGQEEENSLRNLVSGKIVNKLTLNLDLKKFLVVDSMNLKNDQNINYVINVNGKSIFLEYTEKYKKSYLNLLIKAFFPNFPNSIFDSPIEKLTVEYILRKAYNIIRVYPEYKSYSNRVFRTNAKQEVIIECFSKLSNDYTHSTFKIRQALNFLTHNFYDINKSHKEFLLSTKDDKGVADIINLKIEELKLQDIKRLENSFEMDSSVDYEENLSDIYKKYSVINFLPPSFFEIDFEFKNSGFFKDLSSGEKQMIFSINSIIYHLINLQSINSEERITYQYFNIILDEIELCFHPEFQRKYVYELLRAIDSTNFILKGINLLFLTHSPFILSDIPSQNVLKIENGDSKPYDSANKTFGSNIYSLLSDTFFMENTIGAFAENKMKWALKILTSSNKKHSSKVIEDLKEVIDCVGEPVIKEQFEYLFNIKFGTDDVAVLQNRIVELENQLKNRKR